MRRSLALAVSIAAVLASCTTGSVEERARKDFASELVAKVPDCKGWATGPKDTELAVFCNEASIDYFDQRTLPTVAAACGDLKRLGFRSITAYGPKDSGKRWTKELTDTEVCVVASN